MAVQEQVTTIEALKCTHEGVEEWHLRYPGLSESAARYMADQINAGALMMPMALRRSARAIERNNPLSALSIRLLVGTGKVSQQDANDAFHVACAAVQSEAERLNETLPWVVAPLPEEKSGASMSLEETPGKANGQSHIGVPSWDECRAIGEVAAVDEALRNLLEDQCEDNATCLIRAVLEAAAAEPHRSESRQLGKPATKAEPT
jgi:hypothetical protein